MPFLSSHMMLIRRKIKKKCSRIQLTSLAILGLALLFISHFTQRGRPNELATYKGVS